MIHDAKPSLEELRHHGVKGQRWGVRKREDTSPDKQAKREAKAQKFVKKSDDLQKRIDSGNKNIAELNSQQSKTFYTHVKISQLKQDQKVLEKAKADSDKHAEAKRQGKLTPTQKKLLIGGAIVGGLIVAGVVEKKIDSGEFRQTVNRGREILTGKKFKFIEAPELKGNWKADQIEKLIVPDINPGYMEAQIGSNMNCRRCTFAYEMRRRGFDVAATRTPTASGQNAIGMFNVLTTDVKDVSQKGGVKLLLNPDAKNPISRHLNYISKSGGLRKFKEPSPAEIFRRLALEPERSRGELGVFWKGGGGHSVAYEIINGKPHIFDCQTGQHFSDWTQMHVDWPDLDGAGWTRLDNVPLDTKFLQRWVKNVK